ncbi:acyl-CoA dehydrogenase family protein [Naumannella cuiyingiana]|uniref:Acyl-CoA dehydrogenase n=1 Tax=Naumannella cuiyingiana TaxID=1347891 RepID=A0A7Z0D6R0_9ACTN|nr:acyl-CoA dehydrogenase family protein [Naumannella cuiyingiana]NYI69870.1 acyl-CoA dehydrogenase [Naumannella cuiyingiana]
METAEFDAVLATVRDLLDSEVIPAEREIEETDRVPDRLRRKAADMGLFGYALPERHGGLDLSMTEEVRLAIELGRGPIAFRSMFGTNNGIAGQVLVNFGTPQQQERWLPGMAAGEVIGAFALTEPEAGSDPSGLTTKAVRDGDGYLINGAKRFITNADVADVFLVFARTGDPADGNRSISVFAVPRDTPGLSVGPSDQKMGQRGAHTAEVWFDSVRVGADALVGGRENDGFAAAMRSLAKGRLHMAGIAVGMADRLIEESTRHALVTRQGGTPIADFQLVQAMLADCATEAYAGRAMVLAAAREFDAGTDTRLAPSAAKLWCTEMAGRVADRAVQIHGGSGYLRESAAERFYRDARLLRLYEGTSEIQRVIVARQLLRRHAEPKGRS